MSAPQDDAPVTCPACGQNVSSPTPDFFVPPQAAMPPGRPPVPTLVATPPAELPRQSGRFQIRRHLGEGSFGRVYEAYDPTLRRVVALKVAKQEVMTTQEQVERFAREARAAANLMHPNVVAAFDSGSEEGRHYIAYAFVPGRSLDQVLSHGRLGLREAVEVVRKLAEALAYAHRQGGCCIATSSPPT